MNEKTGTNELFDSYQVCWDGNSIWINAPVCIGRFGRAQGELYYSGCNGGDVVPKEEYSSWISRVFRVFKIYVPSEAEPLWSRKVSS